MSYTRYGPGNILFPKNDRIQFLLQIKAKKEPLRNSIHEGAGLLCEISSNPLTVSQNRLKEFQRLLTHFIY